MENSLTVRNQKTSLTLQIVFNPSNPVQSIRNLTNFGSKELIGPMLEKVNMMVHGGELVQVRLRD